MQAMSAAARDAEHLLGRPMDAETMAAELAEPLDESAPIAFRMAFETCGSNGVHGSCRAYHAVWQYLRLADATPSLKVDGAMYAAAAERLARRGGLRRVLVTATADYSLLAHLAFGARRGGADPIFHIVDRCATTLALNKWYGDRTGLKVEVTESDVLGFHSDHSYDLVCSHSFVHWLSPNDRPAIFRLWRRCLADEGRLCFSNRVWQERLRYSAGEMNERVEQIVDKTLAGLHAKEVPLPCDTDEFSALLRQYGHRRSEHLPLRLPDIESWITDARLALEVAVPPAEFVPKSRDGNAGPFPSSRGPRLWFQARPA